MIIFNTTSSPETPDDGTGLPWTDLPSAEDTSSAELVDSTSWIITTEDDDDDEFLLRKLAALVGVLLIGLIVIGGICACCCKKRKKTKKPDVSTEVTLDTLRGNVSSSDMQTAVAVMSATQNEVRQKKVTKAMQKLLDSTWIYEEQRRGRDATGLGHIGLKLKKLHRFKNNPLLWSYNNARKSFEERTDTMPERCFPPIETKSIISDQPVLTADLESDFKKLPCNPRINELYLFHGTPIENVENIFSRGFSLDAAHEGLYGKAVYFSDSAMKADQYADRYTNRRTKGLTMLVVRVILGHAYPHTGDTPVNALPCSQPDCMTPSCGTHRRYDSLVAGKGKLFKEFLMYDTNRCFPQFLITYDRVMKQPKKCCF